jgi:hypothetical protein
MFQLLISNPIALKDMDAEDSTVNEALQTIYPSTKESAVYMKWNNYILQMNLTAEIADVFSDIIKMMEALVNQQEFSIHWGSNVFFATWKFAVDDSLLKINAEWTSLRGAGETLSEIKKVPNHLTINKSDFIKEWLELLRMIKQDLLKAGYTHEMIEDLYVLDNLEKYSAAI